MTENRSARPRRRTTVVIIAALVVVILAVIAIGVATSQRRADPAATGTTSPSAVAPASAPTAGSPASATSTPSSTRTPTVVVPTAASTPQATRTAAIGAPSAVPITRELTASVVKMEAVSGQADGPGEIAGPSVRFTIRITNGTGASVSLSDTVVNAYSGRAATPAVQLQRPGGKDFPASVPAGGSATGVFVFNIPDASRSRVEVTVDTSVRNPVIAFRGAAPRA